MASTSGRRIIVPLTNKSGGSVIAGDVVILDGANDDSFTTTTTSGSTATVGIAQESIANNATGRVLLQGEAALVNVAASVTRGHYGKTHTVAKQATSQAARGTGTFCQFKTGGTTPKAILWGSDPSTSGVSAPDVQLFNTAGNTTWTKPAGAVWVEVVCVGGGNGGASGRKGAASTARYGGGGGGAGGVSRKRLLASDLGATEKLTVGAGGTGGAGRTTSDTDGAGGSGATASFFGNSVDGVQTDAKVMGNAGQPGTAGGASAGSGAGGPPGGGNWNSRIDHYQIAFQNTLDQNKLASGGSSILTGTAYEGNPFYACGGGGAGGAVDASNNERAGGNGGVPSEKLGLSNANGGAVHAAGTAGAVISGETFPYMGAGGGGGGGSKTAANIGTGGAGGFPGGGGGGGGAGVNAVVDSGAGGNGSKGAVWVITHFA